MADLTTAYLDRLEERLYRKLPKSEVEEHVKEVRAHLVESIATLEIEENADPELAALKRIGPDKLLAKNLIRARKGLDTRPGWRFVALPALLLAIYGVIVVHVGADQHIAAVYQHLAEFLTVAIPTTLLYGMVRARRLLISPTLAAFVPFMLIFVGGDLIWGHFGISDYSARKRVETIAGFQAHLDDLEGNITAGQSVRSGAAFPVKLKRDKSYLAPVLSKAVNHHMALGIVVAHEKVGGYYLQEVATEAQARADWLKNGEAYFAHAQKQINEQKNGIKMWTETKTGLVYLPSLLWAFVKFTTPFVLGLLAIGGLLIALGSAKDRLTTALWKPERLIAP